MSVVAAMTNLTVMKSIQAGFETFQAQFGHFFKRSETRSRAGDYMRGLLAEVDRKNGWQLAEKMGAADPQGFQRLLYEAKWEHEAVRDQLQVMVVERMGDADGVGIIDESGYVKKGAKSAGVGRQYCGRIGKVENCQVGVGLAYLTLEGRALIDQRLYLPKSWCDDPDRCRAAHIPPDTTFQTKPQIAQQMLEAAWQNDVPMKWVCADTVYGNASQLREAIAATGRWYVMGITPNQRVQRPGDAQPQKISQLLPALGARDWQPVGIAWSEDGERVYEWTALRVTSPTDDVGEQWLLVRRDPDDTDPVRFFLSNAPADTPLLTLVGVALARHHIEQIFEEAKSHTGMADYEVRHWHSWHRHMVLVMMAHTWLTLFQPAFDIPKKVHSHAGSS
jgi:SRSO17 transposase